MWFLFLKKIYKHDYCKIDYLQQREMITLKYNFITKGRQ